MKYRLLHILCLCGLMACLPSCIDDTYSDIEKLPDGEATISATVEFKPLAEGLTGASSRGTNGDAIQEIKTLYTLFYNEQGILVLKEKNDFATSSKPSGSENYPPQDESDHKVTYKMRVPFGRYRMYAVANLNLDNEKYAEALKSIDGLRSISLDWNKENIAENNQMFGFFTEENEWDTEVIEHDADLIEISQSTGLQFHAWLKRAASKVTIEFDGTKLNNNIYIYLKSAQIKDIPAYCLLGKKNAPNSKAELVEEEENDSEATLNGRTIIYGSANDYNQWPQITNGQAHYPQEVGKYHNDNASESLFFYENMQGEGKDKKQVWKDSNNPQDGLLQSYKDDKLWGSYIEVKAYYENRNQGEVTKGNIIYRFMLGQNITTNYDAKRNYHYKLTLMFKGNANEVDWHIEYEEEPGIYVPNPYYISYLYNESMKLPIRFVGGKVTNIKAEIIENNWKPDTQDNVYYPNNATPSDKAGSTGFLTLWKSDKIIIGDKIQDQNVTTDDTEKETKRKENTEKWIQSFWEGNTKEDGVESHLQGQRDYPLTPNDDYTYEEKGGETTVEIPFWTRSKQIVPWSGYTGNNIYVSYQRYAIVKISATITTEDGKVINDEKEVKIIQEKRIVNPAGIWRKENSSQPFDVELKTQRSEKESNFDPLISIGPWRATIEQGDWFTINDGTEGTSNDKKTIDGKTKTPIKFTYTPKPISGIHCGIIKIEYHNYTCVHRIFVRQGYAALDMGSGAKWCSSNMDAANDGTKAIFIVGSPLDEGALFRFGNYEQGIASSNNQTYGFGINPAGGKFKLYNNQPDASWDEIKPQFNDKWESSVFTLPGNDYRIAKYEDYNYLRNNCKIGYGVLYGDGATKTANTVEEAYGFTKVPGAESTKGMRGCFVYDPKDGKNLFFPIGATGYGRRKSSRDDQTSPDVDGTLRYANSPVRIENSVRPMLWDINESWGAIYWCREVQTNNETHAAWDINYRTLDFDDFEGNSIPTKNKEINSDACFVRCIYTGN